MNPIIDENSTKAGSIPYGYSTTQKRTFKPKPYVSDAQQPASGKFPSKPRAKPQVLKKSLHRLAVDEDFLEDVPNNLQQKNAEKGP
jgi:hypothetical protein